jgi:hypothetical protein
VPGIAQGDDGDAVLPGLVDASRVACSPITWPNPLWPSTMAMVSVSEITERRWPGNTRLPIHDT